MTSLLIPEISEKIEKTLKKLGLKPKESPDKFITKTKGRKHRYSSICKNRKGKKVMFYARLHDLVHEKERMCAEVKIAQVLIKKKKLFRGFPRYFNTKIEKNFEWLVREYFPKTPLEDKRKSEKLKRSLKSKEIQEIARDILLMQRLNPSNFPFLKKFDLKKYFDLEKSIQEERILRRGGLKKLKQILQENKKLLKTENCAFCHGDLQIGNILFFDKTLRIIDLESAHINNFAFDIAFLFSRLWRENEMRKKILITFLSLLPKERLKIFEILFRIDCLFVGYHSFMADPREYSKNMLKKRKKFYTNLIKKSLESFEALRKI